MENRSLMVECRGRRMRIEKMVVPALVAALLPLSAADSQPRPFPTPLSYADLADLAVPAPVAAHVRVTRAVRLKREDAVGVQPGKTRFYVEADVLSLIRGAGALPPKVSYLVDLPNDARGKAPKFAKKTEFLLLASPVPGRPGELRLVAPDAQLAWSPGQGDRVRKVIAEATRGDAPPPITGIGRAFHVAGTVLGEGETQIFLQTADGRPVSLNVLRRPGQRPFWSVALSEIVDEGATTPMRETLLWYRLACSLPKTLPAQSLADAEPEQVHAIQSDYRYVLEQLGPCTRNRRGA